MENKDTGLLIDKQNTNLQRQYFKEMLRLKGIMVLHRAPRPESKDYDLHGELDALYCEPTQTACIFEEHPNQWTMKKLGWATSLQEDVSLIHIPYDLEGVQAGSLFIIPSGLDNSEGRVFKVIRMSNIAVFPSEIICEIAPMMVNRLAKSETTDFTMTNFNLLNEEKDDD